MTLLITCKYSGAASSLLQFHYMWGFHLSFFQRFFWNTLSNHQFPQDGVTNKYFCLLLQTCVREVPLLIESHEIEGPRYSLYLMVFQCIHLCLSDRLYNSTMKSQRLMSAVSPDMYVQGTSQPGSSHFVNVCRLPAQSSHQKASGHSNDITSILPCGAFL